MRTRSVCTAAAALALVAALLLPRAALAEVGLTTGTWRFVEIEGRRLEALATISFSRVRFVGLNTPCQAEWGSFSRSGAELSIRIAGRGARTVSGPGQAGRRCRGIDYQEALSRVRSHAIEDGMLMLRDGEARPVARLVQQ